MLLFMWSFRILIILEENNKNTYNDVNKEQEENEVNYNKSKVEEEKCERKNRGNKLFKDDLSRYYYNSN